jgi:RNA polymerase sigma factor (TIGR02999 family)
MADDATRLLAALNAGDARATADLLPLVYHELRELAGAHMRTERPGHTLQATALVHEAYVRLVNDGVGSWRDRRHFLAAASEAMRRILIEHARHRNTLKNGGGRQRLSEPAEEDLPTIQSPVERVEDLLALDEALGLFAEHDPAKAELVKLLFFAGLNLDDAADTVGISRATAYRHWVYARAWLFNAMGQPSR